MPIRVPVEYDTDAAGLDRQLSGDMSKAGRKAGGSFSSGFKKLVGPLAGFAAGAVVGDFLRDSLSEARESQKVGALSAQVIKSTGSAANVTAKEMEELAGVISRKTAIDDEQIQAGENLLATFTNIKNGAKEQNKIFDQATTAAVDLAAGLAAVNGGEVNLKTATTLVGKALDDPIKGLTALTRVGIRFTDAQKERIKGLVEEGKTMEAQRIILGRLEDKFGGAAASQVTASDKARIAIKELEEQVGTALLPVIDDLAEKVTNDVVPAISEFITEMQDGTGEGGKFVDVLQEDLLPTAKELTEDVLSLGKAFSPLLSALGSLPTSVQSNVLLLGTFSRALSNFTPQLDAGASKSVKFQSAMRGLAGAGGLTLMTNATQQTSRELGVLESAIGGALTGFAVSGGNPVGALIGGVAGGLIGVATSSGDAAEGLDKVADSAAATLLTADDLASSLDEVTAAYTKLTRKLIAEDLRKTGALDAGAELGLSYTTVVNAALGVPRAVKKVNAVLAVAGFNASAAANGVTLLADGTVLAAGKAIKLGNAAGLLDKSLSAVSGTTAEARRDILQVAIATGEYNKTLEHVPQDLILKIGTEGRQKAIADILALDHQADVTDKELEILLEVAQLPKTLAELRAVDKAADHTARPRNLDINVGFKLNDAKLNQLLRLDAPGRAMGGPVTAGQPYIVGERRPELFIPNQSGRIVPRVPTATTATESSAPVSIVQNYYGPTTGRERLREIEWTLKYATRARAV